MLSARNHAGLLLVGCLLLAACEPSPKLGSEGVGGRISATGLQPTPGDKRGTDAGTGGAIHSDSTPPPCDDAGRKMHVMVANDDGYGAAGIDALVEALWARPEFVVSVVAPADNRSGTGGSTTPGVITATDAKTGAGRPAKAVAGYPADCVTWAVDQQGLPEPPDLVLSGINIGENIGCVVEVSGTVGAARAAAARGIPALAVSQVTNGDRTDYAAGAALVLRWVDEHKADILCGEAKVASLLENMNIPNCSTGSIRGVVHAPLATKNDNNAVLIDCMSTLTDPANDVEALNVGFAVVSVLPPTLDANTGCLH